MLGQTIGLHLPAEHLRVWAAQAALDEADMDPAGRAGSAA